MPYTRWQTCLMPTTAREALAANLQWVQENTELDSQAKIGARAKIDQKTVGRYMNGSHAATLDSVQKLADVLKIEPWQMLAPSFGEGLHTIKGKSIEPVTRPGAKPTAAKDALGIPYLNPAKPPQATEPPSQPAKAAPRAGKRPGGGAPKRGARAGR
jgi:transcriptional regulator with XRE-family HTH domain